MIKFIKTVAEMRLKLSILFIQIVLLFISGCGDDKTIINNPPPSGQTAFQKTYGGTENEEAKTIISIPGGYMVAGYTSTFGAGSTDLYLLRLSEDGNIVWTKTYGGTNIDQMGSVSLASDGGYTIAASTLSFGSQSNMDIYILHVSSDGSVIWHRTFSGTGYDYANSIYLTNDGGYIITGNINSSVTGSIDAYALRLSSSGSTIWARSFGGGDIEDANSVLQTSDGGFIVAGRTNSFGAGSGDVYVVRLSSSGGLIWSKSFGGPSNDVANFVTQTSDGGFIVACSSLSFGAGSYDALVLRLSSSGNLMWAKTIGGSGHDEANSVSLTTEGGFIITGTESFSTGGSDAFVLKLSTEGNIIWLKTFGGPYIDVGSSIFQTPDGGYIAAGYSYYIGPGGIDIFVFKLTSDGNVCGGMTPSYLESSPSLPSLTVSSITGAPVLNTGLASPLTGMPVMLDSVLCTGTQVPQP